jgi:NADH-quinone oxidoreductase subunit L
VAVGIFHLFNHAFFKALLFLGAGSVNHATGTFDMREMGGLRKVMPWTTGLFIVASLSLSGIWPFSGFWSKDQILSSALDKQPVLFALVLITVFMTAFYIFRVFFLTFGGESRAQPHHSGEHGAHGRPHESPMVMVIPMLVLGILAVVSGFWNVGGQFNSFMGEAGESQSFISGLFGVFTHPLPWISLAIGLLGIFTAYAMYSARWISPQKVGNLLKPLYNVFYNKYWLDQLYENVIVKIALLGGIFAGMRWFDSNVVDGTANDVGNVTISTGKAIRRVQTGYLQLYGLMIALGIVAIIIFVLIFGR